jgi:hypothetical protein
LAEKFAAILDEIRAKMMVTKTLPNVISSIIPH